VKLHLLIAPSNLAILNLNITKGTRHHSPILEKLLKPIPEGVDATCLDPAYLSRQNCNLIAMKGRTPIIKPKRNTTIRKRGSQPWRDMIPLWLEDKESFVKRDHQRSKAESVYSSLKRCYGNYLSSRKRKTQRRELHLGILTYNIGMDNLTNIREQNGKLSTTLVAS
jgi:transposase